MQSAVFKAGLFKVSQRLQLAKLITRLVLTGGDFSQCRSGPGQSPPRKRVRRISGEGEGAFATKGRYGTATSSSTLQTKWSTVDQCRGTLMQASTGGLTVRDLVRGKTVHLGPGERYLAKKPGS